MKDLESRVLFRVPRTSQKPNISFQPATSNLLLFGSAVAVVVVFRLEANVTGGCSKELLTCKIIRDAVMHQAVVALGWPRGCSWDVVTWSRWKTPRNWWKKVDPARYKVGVLTHRTTFFPQKNGYTRWEISGARWLSFFFKSLEVCLPNDVLQSLFIPLLFLFEHVFAKKYLKHHNNVSL